MIRFYRSTVVALMYLFIATPVHSQLILAHYAPWFGSKPVSGVWSYHWAMGHFDPDNILPNGQREISSWHYPLIGPYDSNDPHALECHALLMKIAGLDGAIINWYSSEPVAGYDILHRNTQHFIEHLKRAGLQFAIMYEDRTLPVMINVGYLSEEEDISHGQKVMKWLADNWFSDAAYVKLNERPVLLVFGPLHFTQVQWNQMRHGLSPQPLIYGLPGLSDETGLDGAFGWVPVGGGDETPPSGWRNYLQYIYTKYDAQESLISIAFPGFRDIYEEAGIRPSFGSLDHRDGETFTETFELAVESGAPIMQIATWNDFGEGTVIEPTREFGYQYLEHIQNRVANDSPYGPDALRLPIRLYELKKKHQQHSARMEQLEQATALLFAGRYAEGQNLIESIVEQYLITIDVNRDGTVNILDLITITQVFGQSVPADLPAADSGRRCIGASILRADGGIRGIGA